MRKIALIGAGLLIAHPAISACNFGPAVFAESTPKSEIIECVRQLRDEISLLEKQLSLQDRLIELSRVRQETTQAAVDRLEQKVLDIRLEMGYRKPPKPTPR